MGSLFLPQQILRYLYVNATSEQTPPAPQPPSGGADSYRVNPEQKLLRLDFNAPPQQCHFGVNQVSVGIVDRAPYECNANIVLEKLEVHVEYN